MSGQDQIYRTSPARTVRMMVIMLGICIAGGAIFFGMWDYWISCMPGVVAGTAASVPTMKTVFSVNDIPVAYM